MKRTLVCILFSITILPMITLARCKKNCISSCYQQPIRNHRQQSFGQRYSTAPITGYRSPQKLAHQPAPQQAGNRSLEKLIKQIKNKESYEEILKTAHEVRSYRTELIRTTATQPIDAVYKGTDLVGAPSLCPKSTCIPRKIIRPHRARCWYAPCKPFCKRYGQI